MIRDFSTEDSLLVWYFLDIILRSLLGLRGGSQQLCPGCAGCWAGCAPMGGAGGNVVGPAGEQRRGAACGCAGHHGTKCWSDPGTPWVELEVAGGWMAGKLGLSADAHCVL